MSIKALVRCLRAPAEGFDSDAASPASIKRLADLGLVRAHGVASSKLCLICDTPHIVDLERHAQGFRYFCAEGGGWISAPLAEAQRWRCDWERIACAIGGAFGVASPKWRAFPEAGMFWLGAFRREVWAEPHRVDLCLALRPAPGSIGPQLSRRPAGMTAKAILVLTTEELTASRGEAPGIAALAPMTDLLRLTSDGAVEVDALLLTDLLKQVLPRGKQAGAPQKYPPTDIKRVVDRALREGLAPSLAEMKGKEFNEAWRREFPGRKAPGDYARLLLRQLRARSMV